jgi:hypothetical protein
MTGRFGVQPAVPVAGSARRMGSLAPERREMKRIRSTIPGTLD